MPVRSDIRYWDPARKQWANSVTKTWDGSSWRPPFGLDAMTLRYSPFDPYIGRGSIWQRNVSQMPIATNSAGQASWVATHINYGSGWGPTSINSSVGGTHPIHPVFIDSRIDNTPYQILNPTSFSNAVNTDPAGKELMQQPVPLPSWVDATTMQSGQDSALALIDIGTGIIREYYAVHPQSGFTNQYTCSANAYSIFHPDPFVNGWPTGTYRTGTRTTDAYTTQCQVGESSVVGMHNWLGWIDIAGSRRGEIDHAVAWTCANLAVPTSAGEAIDQNGVRYTTVGPSWPAKGGDGDTANPDDSVPIHGQWATLPTTLDLSDQGPYPPFLRMIIKAIQKYGMVCTDSNNFVHAFNAEPGFYEKAFLGVDPWSTAGDLYQKYAALNAYEGRTGVGPFDMSKFPWDQTMWAPRHWGAPNRINEQA